jgi:hypothetical protein
MTNAQFFNSVLQLNGHQFTVADLFKNTFSEAWIIGVSKPDDVFTSFYTAYNIPVTAFKRFPREGNRAARIKELGYKKIYLYVSSISGVDLLTKAGAKDLFLESPNQPEHSWGWLGLNLVNTRLEKITITL